MIIRVEFLPESRLYDYLCDFEVEVGDLVAVPPNEFRPEGTVAVVRGTGEKSEFKGELKSAWRRLPRSEWGMHGYEPGG